MVFVGRHQFFLVVLVWIGFLFDPAGQVAQALTFNLSFDASTNNAPASFFSAFDSAIQYYETTFSNPITINLQVGWGEVNGIALTPGFLGESQAAQPGFFKYATVKSALVTHAMSAADMISVSHMMATDPTGGATFKLSRTQSKALGFMNANAAGVDGSVGFDSTASYTFDPNNRAVNGKVDFIGLAGHEVTEVMGRFGVGQAGTGSGQFGALDFFRYTSPGVLDTVPENGAYFSIDGGTTKINTFNGTGSGDLSDWSGETYDSYNAFFVAGKELAVSPGDVTVMDVIGYDPLLPGDFNHDGHVNAADIQIMMQAIAGTSAFQANNDLTYPAFTKLADINGDGEVNIADLQSLLILLKSGGGSNNSVPEPSTCVLVLMAIGILWGRVRYCLELDPRRLAIIAVSSTR